MLVHNSSCSYDNVQTTPHPYPLKTRPIGIKKNPKPSILTSTPNTHIYKPATKHSI